MEASVYFDRVSLPGWNRKVRASENGRALRKALRARGECVPQPIHARRAAFYLARHKRLSALWSVAWDRAIREALGRAPEFGDYRVCAIGREDLPEAWKERLRAYAYGSTEAGDRARSHAWCAFPRSPAKREAIFGAKVGA